MSVTNLFEWGVRQLALIFEREIDIREALYSPFSGRVYNDTWGGRRTATDTIDNIADYLEHVCRLQNWTESGGAEVEAGRAYGSTPLINVSHAELTLTSTSGTFVAGGAITIDGVAAKTIRYDGVTKKLTIGLSGTTVPALSVGLSVNQGAPLDLASGTISVIDYDTGGFDTPAIRALRSIPVAFQIDNENVGETHNQKAEACRHAWCVSYVNEHGEESVAYLPQTSLIAPVDTITLSDVPHNMQPGDVQEPYIGDAYCEPFVRYAYDPGSKDYTGYLGVRRTSASTYDSNYALGLSGGDGERIWQRCHDELWSRFRSVQRPPEALTNLPFFYSYSAAVGYIDNWITWQTRKKISVPVYYDKARLWHVGRHVYLNLPHQTGGVAVECVVNMLEKNHIEGFCRVGLTMLDDLPEDFYIQDVTYTAAQGASADWQDTTTEYGSANDKISII